jgi:hypothetical protein
VDTVTGAVGDTQEVVKACGSRIASKCPNCSKIYRGDAYALFRSGLKDDDGNDVPLTFLTFTAPGADAFGQVHLRRMKYKKNGMRYHYGCECGRYHHEGDAVLGQPINLSTYDYSAAAEWNTKSARLFTVTLQKLARLTFGTDAKGKPLNKFEYIRVAEYQRRGLIHFHVLVRGNIDVRDFHAVVRGGTTSRGKQSAKVSHLGIEWGHECHLASVAPNGRFRIGTYLVKMVNYALKSTGDDQDGGGLMARRMRAASLHSCGCRSDVECDASIVRRPVSGVRSLCARHRRARDGWGYRGHVLSKSRSWGTTFREIRAKRLPADSAPLMTLSDYQRAVDVGEDFVTPPKVALWRRVIFEPPSDPIRRQD